MGIHGEDYGSRMSNPVFYVFGGLAALAVLSFTMFHLAALGVLLAVVTAALAAMLIWMAWRICRQYAFGKGGVFLLHDNMKPQFYGDMNAFAEKLRAIGFAEVRYVDTADAIFGSKRRAGMTLGESAMVIGRE